MLGQKADGPLIDETQWKATEALHNIAGGERALFAAAELAEDEAGKAVEDLVSLERQHRGGRGWSRVLYVGITCGLSATYVGAQLEYALKTPHYAAVLVGFNPVERARKVKMADWGRTLMYIGGVYLFLTNTGLFMMMMMLYSFMQRQ